MQMCVPLQLLLVGGNGLPCFENRAVIVEMNWAECRFVLWRTEVRGGEQRERERGQWTGQTADARSHGSRINKRTQEEELRWAGNSGFGRFPRCPVAEIFVWFMCLQGMFDLLKMNISIFCNAKKMILTKFYKLNTWEISCIWLCTSFEYIDVEF